MNTKLKTDINRNIPDGVLKQIRSLGDFDLIMFLSEIHDHGWLRARMLLLAIQFSHGQITEEELNVETKKLNRGAQLNVARGQWV